MVHLIKHRLTAKGEFLDSGEVFHLKKLLKFLFEAYESSTDAIQKRPLFSYVENHYLKHFVMIKNIKTRLITESNNLLCCYCCHLALF